MANKSKQKGTRAETEVVKFLNDHGFQAERMALSGSNDKGDIKVTTEYGDTFVLEVKAGKQTDNPSRSQMEEWLSQSVVEQYNSGYTCMLIVRRYRRRINDAEVWYQTEDGLKFVYLDEFVNRYSWFIYD